MNSFWRIRVLTVFQGCFVMYSLCDLQVAYGDHVVSSLSWWHLVLHRSCSLSRCCVGVLVQIQDCLFCDRDHNRELVLSLNQQCVGVACSLFQCWCRIASFNLKFILVIESWRCFLFGYVLAFQDCLFLGSIVVWFCMVCQDFFLLLLGFQFDLVQISLGMLFLPAWVHHQQVSKYLGGLYKIRKFQSRWLNLLGDNKNFCTSFKQCMQYTSFSTFVSIR